jgi:hypothetical protein
MKKIGRITKKREKDILKNITINFWIYLAVWVHIGFNVLLLCFRSLYNSPKNKNEKNKKCLW